MSSAERVRSHRSASAWQSLLRKEIRDGSELTSGSIVKAALLVFGASGLLAVILYYLGA